MDGKPALYWRLCPAVKWWMGYLCRALLQHNVEVKTSVIHWFPIKRFTCIVELQKEKRCKVRQTGLQRKQCPFVTQSTLTIRYWLSCKPLQQIIWGNVTLCMRYIMTLKLRPPTWMHSLWFVVRVIQMVLLEDIDMCIDVHMDSWLPFMEETNYLLSASNLIH